VGGGVGVGGGGVGVMASDRRAPRAGRGARSERCGARGARLTCVELRVWMTDGMACDANPSRVARVGGDGHIGEIL
jgi:hypothetical protein